MNRQRLHTALGLSLLCALLVLLVFLRAQLVDQFVGRYIACPGCFNSSVMMADLVVFSLAAGILLFAGLLTPGWLARTVQLLSGVLILIYVTDLVVFRLFHSRLFLSDAALFINERSAVWEQFYTGVGGRGPALALIGLVLSVFVLLALMPPVRGRAQRLVLIAVLVLSMTAGIMSESRPYVNAWAIDNVFAANLATTERVTYSAGKATAVLAGRRPPRYISIAPGNMRIERRNVVLVILESWSPWHSKLFGGREDWTPKLDAAALRGVRFTHFHCIGFSTDKGLMGILAGLQIWAPFLHPFEASPFRTAWGLDRTLPAVFSRQGYQTAFLTSGPLSLYRKGEWLKDLGFGYIEGNRHPFYAGKPRFAFNSASDAALYGRARQWQGNAPAPYFLVLETVSTHQPYKDPVTGKRSLQRAMRYADQAFGDFLQDLDRSGYFTNGILVVVSDHRSMTPIPLEELESQGADAHSRVPAFILGEGFGAGIVDDRVYSQADLVPSFELWLSGATKLGALQALMLNAPRLSGRSNGEPETTEPVVAMPPNCAFHSRGDQRGLVEVICNSGRGKIILDGDQTRFIHHEGLADMEQKRVLNTLAALRLEGLRRHKARQAAVQ